MTIPSWYPNQALRELRREQDARTHEASMRAETERIRQCKDPNCPCKDPPPNWEGTEE
jgi:hypothetical protein